MNEDMKQRRLALLQEHFDSEVDREFDRTVATFADTPRYEIMPTGQIYEGEEAVIAYHTAQRNAFPDQHQENVRFHFADDEVISEFELVGTNTGEFMGGAPTGKSFRVPLVAVFSFDGDKITNERVYLDLLTMLRQIDRLDLLSTMGGDAMV
jgi:steroid delta-isomerase-like uncharacterized protein